MEAREYSYLGRRGPTEPRVVKRKVGTCQTTGQTVIGMITLAVLRAQRRAGLLKRVERWTYQRKIELCIGLRANLVTVSDAVLAHGLGQDEIDRWMEAYRNRDFEALKATYQKSKAA
jgi:hypothetical protein